VPIDIIGSDAYLIVDFMAAYYLRFADSFVSINCSKIDYTEFFPEDLAKFLIKMNSERQLKTEKKHIEFTSFCDNRNQTETAKTS
jgi:hypothetical protein